MPGQRFDCFHWKGFLSRADYLGLGPGLWPGRPEDHYGRPIKGKPQVRAAGARANHTPARRRAGRASRPAGTSRCHRPAGP